MAWRPYMLGRGCTRQIFTRCDSIAFKQLHYHLYTVQLLLTEWHYLQTVSSCMAAAGKLPPSTSSRGQEWPSSTGGDSGKINKRGNKRCSCKQSER